MSSVAVELSEPSHPGRMVVQECKGEMRATLAQLARDLNAAEPDNLADGLLLIIEGAVATHHIFGSLGPAHSMLATCDALIESHMK